MMSVATTNAVVTGHNNSLHCLSLPKIRSVWMRKALGRVAANGH